MIKMKRGVGYCEDVNCEEYSRGVFLLNHEGCFYCPNCRKKGRVERERGFHAGDAEVFKEVRVEYNFDPVSGVYRDLAIVQDVSLCGRSSVYTLQSPLIRTEKRALKVAEAILANLNRCPELIHKDEIPNATEVVLSFDDDREEFTRKLEQLASEWQNSGLRQRLPL
jgi:hypothetical protein